MTDEKRKENERLADGDEEAETPALDGDPADAGPDGRHDAEAEAGEKKKGGRAAKASPKEKRADDAPAKTDDGPDEEDAPREASGRAHLIRGAAITAVGVFGTFLLMANEAQVPHGPLFGMLTTLIGIGGILDLLGLWTAPPAADRTPVTETVFFPREGEPLLLSPLVTAPASLVVLVIGAAAGGYEGLPITLAIAVALLIPSALRRPGLMVFVAAGLLYLPFLGAYGLWDPWETHYGEVAREILARDDWISLWWAQEDWFWSKPILIFWSEALSMGALGVDYRPDANPLHPEWAIRLPHFLLATGALLAVYALVSRVWTKRAGLVTAVVLATMPHFFFLSHQAITDMPFVANMTMAVCMLGLAVRQDPEREVRRFALGPLTVSGRHLLIGALSAVILPQVLYLITRNVTWIHDGGAPFGWHGDLFMSGSAGNHGVPGNSPVHNVDPYMSGLAAQPAVQGLIWLVGYLVILGQLHRERRAQTLYMYAFYLFCGLAFMAKGIPGFALPGLVALFFLIGTRRWDLLLSGRLRVSSGILTVAVVGLPWYVAMYIRHGPPFTDRLLIHDHINRLTAGVHGDNGSIEYFIEQLGYGLFPWIGLAPLALAAWLALRGDEGTPSAPVAARPPRELSDRARQVLKWSILGALGAAVLAALGGALVSASTLFAVLAVLFGVTAAGGIVTALLTYMWLAPSRVGRSRPVAPRDVLVLVALWLASAFTLFSAMTTKFHHYIFPAVPPAGILAGLALDRLLNRRAERFDGRAVARTALAILAPVPAVLGVAGLWGDVRGVIPREVEAEQRGDWVMSHGWPEATCVSLILLGAGLLAAAWWLARASDQHARRRRRWTRGAMATGLLGAAPVLALVGRDLSWVTDARPQGFERLIHLFVYNYGRPWPDHFDYRPILTGFAIVAVALLVLAAARPLRDAAMRGFLGLALAFCVWSLDVYMIDLSPHWGQKELVQEYYERRGSPEEPLVAWQMNWKGENFYSGNRVHVFVQLDNRALREWVADNPGRRAWFLLEHARLNNLRGVLRGSELEEITDERLDNKFVLVRVDLAGGDRPRERSAR
ncbi:MAG TPA: glycosyltransferase family 39 protein [Sandaracinaceae bacterium LLY-WYZ-13_1]|nr:glycosyltransferase family 39 protein [Sandaracinaceae bacterium LLY-WYZ-13_1]